METIDPTAWAGRSVLLLAPHADDEALGCGGFAHRLVRNGARVVPVVLARGDGGVDGAAQPEQREQESREGCRVLDLDPPRFGRVPSRELRDDPAAAGHVLTELLAGEERADAVLVPAPWERHDTHRAVLLAALCSSVGQPAATWWGYGVWDALPAGPDTHEVDISAARATKVAALSCYGSQMASRPFVAASSSRDLAQAVFSNITGDEKRKAVERVVELTALGRQAPFPDARAAATAVRAWLDEHARRTHAALWP